MTGVPGEEAVTAAVTARMRAPAANLCGQTALGPFAALLSSADVLVANDSGPAHLAAALGTPSVTVFLAGDARRWAAFDRDRHRVVEAGVPCQPCGHQECPIDFRCAANVAVGSVVQAVDHLLHGSASDQQAETLEKRA